MKRRIPRKLKKRIKKACNITGKVGGVNSVPWFHGFVEHQNRLMSIAYSMFPCDDECIGKVGQIISFNE